MQALSERLFLGGRGFAIACSVGPGGSDGGEKRVGGVGEGKDRYVRYAGKQRDAASCSPVQ